MNVLVVEEREKVRERIIQFIEDQPGRYEYQCMSAEELVSGNKTVTADVVLISDEILPETLERICKKLRKLKLKKTCVLITTQSGYVRKYLQERLECVIDIVNAPDAFADLFENPE